MNNKRKESQVGINKWLRPLIGIAVTALALWLTFRDIDWTLLWTSLRRIDPSWTALAFLVPLAAVYLIEHGPLHAVRTIGRAEATAQLTGQIVPPVGLTEALTSAATAGALDAAVRLADQVPVAILSFRPDAGFWSAIDRHEQRRER